jgi:hypothetical protein
VGFQPNDPGDHPIDGPGIQIPAAAPKNVLRPRRFRWFVSRGSRYFEIFREGVPPVETVLGESCGSNAKMEQSTVFQSANYRHDSARGSGRLEIALPDSRSRLILRLSGLWRNSLPIPLFEEPEEKRLPFANSLPTPTFVSRASSAIHISRLVTGLVTLVVTLDEARIFDS